MNLRAAQESVTWEIGDEKMVCGLAVVAAIAPSLAHAQLKIDMTLVTFAQYLAMPPDQAANFAAWMSGWFNQKQGYAWINLEAYNRNIAKRDGVFAGRPE